MNFIIVKAIDPRPFRFAVIDLVSMKVVSRHSTLALAKEMLRILTETRNPS